ncbi:MAG: acyl-CoA dehydrogenase family protein, partial [Planctomycetota bacterium]
MKSSRPSNVKSAKTPAVLRTLPGDDVRQVLWRFAGRYDLQMLVQSVRAVARGPVARLVAAGARNGHDWTEDKAALLDAFDEAGITAMFVDPDYGGYLDGPKNLASALTAFELAWVDGGAATSSLAGHLGLAPIHHRGTEEQKQNYLTRSLPGATGGRIYGAFALTEPIPYVGVDTGVLSGKVRIAEWQDGAEPMLQVDKRGRFITNMDFANVVTAAVDSADPRIKGSCMVILEEDDGGTFDRGAATMKLVHQLSSTRDPIFSQRIPCSRIIGGYTVVDGTIVPNFTHSQILEAVFRRTRVPVGLMTSAKLLSAIEPIIRYQRGRFRGGENATPGTPRYELGLQQKEDVLQRLIDVWATGEASAALGFAAARLFDEYDPVEHEKERIFAGRELTSGRAQMRALRELEAPAIEYVNLLNQANDGPNEEANEEPDSARLSELRNDPLVQYVVMDSLANVLCPATKLWNTGHGANLMREAVSLMGGYGITEDCPGFLGQKWMDAQLEATYEGPEAVQRRQLAVTMTNKVFLAQVRSWIKELKAMAGEDPHQGACTLGSAFDLWLWTLEHLQGARDANDKPLYKDQRHGVTFLMADALCWLLASRCQMLDVRELAAKGRDNPSLAEGLPGYLQFFTDLCRVQAARAAGEVSRICTELVFGYQRHPQWDDCGACFHAQHLEHLEETMPGI